MKIIVGLGNPGEKYKNNRHNAGFMLADRLIEVRSQKSEVRMERKFESLVCKVGDVLLVKPQTFMNESGKAVSQILNFYKIKPEDLYVIHDDLDLRLGEYKIQFGIGPKVHNGVNSIEEKLGSKDFWRVRVGIDNRQRANGIWQIAGEDYVLEDFLPEEMVILNETEGKIVKDLEGVLK